MYNFVKMSILTYFGDISTPKDVNRFQCLNEINKKNKLILIKTHHSHPTPKLISKTLLSYTIFLYSLRFRSQLTNTYIITSKHSWVALIIVQLS